MHGEVAGEGRGGQSQLGAEQTKLDALQETLGRLDQALAAPVKQ